jgi:beta-galactosidase
MKFPPLAILLITLLGVARAQPIDVVPVRSGAGTHSLNGAWRFKYLPTSDAKADEHFVEPAFDVAAWKRIQVPGHWELQGFAEPKYAGDLEEGLGLYRRSFRSEPQWQGQRVFLRFDGVLYGFSAWVNGRKVGEWASGFNPATFDITDALKPAGGDNVLAVRVSTRSRGWDFDTMDCWSLSGVYRDVTVFALPATHFADYTVRTELKPDGAAELQLEFVATAAAMVTGKLMAPDGSLAKEFRCTLAGDGRGTTKFLIEHPKLWTAESPWLYRIDFDLKSGDTPLQHVADRVGLRQVTIDGGIFKLNGTPIKLHGIDHHDIWPEEGRVATEERMRRDLELMRAANINFVRTSHYPPHPRFIELCDELGIYVDCEVPFIHGRKNLSDPTYQDALLTRARATVMRDKNRPSIILWSVGNENHVNALGLNAGRLVKQLDPTRPITFPTMGSHFKTNYQEYPEFVDLYSPHYPGVGTIRNYAERLARPIVVTEYAHQRGQARGGEGVQDIWEAMYRAPRVAGGAVWMFQDQGILRTAPNLKSVENGDLMVWLDEHRYYDTHGYFGVDGIVFSDRTPQVDYWQVRKVYSPVQIAERSLRVSAGAKALDLHVENRFDFRALAGIKLEWSLNLNRDSISGGLVQLQARPHEVERVTIPAVLPEKLNGNVATLELRCLDETGRSFHERSIELEVGGVMSRLPSLEATLLPGELTLDVSDTLVSVRHRNYVLRLDRKSGQLSISDPSGAAIASAVGPHTARKLTINDLGKKREGEATHWAGELLRDVTQLTTDAKQTADGVVVTVGGVYGRPGSAKEAVEGECRLRLTRSGTIEVSYHYVPVAASGAMVEAGLAFAVSPAQSEFRWIGQGPYAGYPGKDRLNEFGVFHLNRDDLYFPGNRRGVELAALMSLGGPGLMIAGDKLTVSVEKREAETIFSHIALVAGAGSDPNGSGENVETKTDIKAASIKSIDGKFTLMPLSKDWPKPLLAWFGSPSTKANRFNPFLRVYDQ